MLQRTIILETLFNLAYCALQHRRTSMVDQTQTDKTIQAVADAAKTTASTVEAVTQAATPKSVAKPAPRAMATKSTPCWVAVSCMPVSP